MSASIKLRAVPEVGAGLTGRGFRGGYRIATGSAPALLVVGHKPGLASRVLEFSPEHVVVDAAMHVGRLGDGTRSGVLRVQGFDDLALNLRPGLSNLRDRRGEIGLDVITPTERVARALIERGAALVRGKLANLPTGRPPMRETLDGARLAEVLRAIASNAFEATARIGDYPVGTAVLFGHDGDRLHWRYTGPMLTGQVRLEVAGYNSVFHIDVDALHVEHGVLVTSRPSEVVRSRHRALRRVAAREVVVEIRHPAWPNLTIRRRVKELSAGGLSFTTRCGEDLLYPELLVEGATLYAGDRVMTFTGEVRSLSSRGHAFSQGEYCGMRVMPSSAEDDGVWQEILDEHLYPSTRKGGRFASDTWELYERAGYFNLSGKATEEFHELRRAFDDVSDKLDRAPHLGCQIVWTGSESGEDAAAPKVQAALSMLKTHSTSWFGYQMAKVSGNTEGGILGRTVLRDIHVHAYEHAQRDGSLRWITGICQVKKVWSRLVHHDLPERYVADGQAAIVRFRAVEIRCTASREIPRDGSMDVGPATEAEAIDLFDQIARERPRPYVEALDLTADGIAFDGLCDDWKLAGLDRRRAVLVVRRGGVPVAGAVLESAEEGAHLFRLLDMVRLFSFSGGDVDESAQGALLAAAAEWFEALGKKAFIAYLEGSAEMPSSLQACATDLGLADFVVLSAALLPELLEHVVEVTAPRESSASV
jgi:hypothetical protein